MTTYKRGSALRRALARLMGRPQMAVRPSRVASSPREVAVGNQLGQLGMLPFTESIKYTKPPANDTTLPRGENQASSMHNPTDSGPLFIYDGFGTPIPRKRSG